MEFKVGDIVECIDAGWSNDFLKVGHHYEVIEIITNHYMNHYIVLRGDITQWVLKRFVLADLSPVEKAVYNL